MYAIIDYVLKRYLGLALTSCAIASVLFIPKNQTLAQVTPDNTLPNNSKVKLQDNIRTITGGTEAGSNLFHSFQEFSVPKDTQAHFNNTVDIQNIITRVTGTSISNIGLLVQLTAWPQMPTNWTRNNRHGTKKWYPRK